MSYLPLDSVDELKKYMLLLTRKMDKLAKDIKKKPRDKYLMGQHEILEAVISKMVKLLEWEVE